MVELILECGHGRKGVIECMPSSAGFGASPLGSSASAPLLLSPGTWDALEEESPGQRTFIMECWRSSSNPHFHNK